jgi:ribA/ribD-fused uncharacterized protein
MTYDDWKGRWTIRHGEEVRVIDAFKDEFAFLSNFCPVTVRYPDYDSPITLTFPSVEHAYQACKTYDQEKRMWVRDAPTASDAKKRGQSLPLRAGWNAQTRLSIMAGLLRQKFSQEPFRSQLLATGPDELIEGNTWHDQFWGDCRCDHHRGQGGINALGDLLMKIRSEIDGTAY